MLSAIAARKAAKAAQLSSNGVPDKIPQDDPPDESLPESDVEPSPPSRKRKAQDSGSPRFPSETPGPGRGYSPSRPVVDSSEDEDHTQKNPVGTSGAGHVSFSAGPQLHRKTFEPRPESNVFRLTREDLDLIQIPSNTVGISDAALLILSSGHSLTFVGTACIILLQGAIAILGTPITPSLHAHCIFSPRSSPLVSLEALDAQTKESSVSPQHWKLPICGALPPRIQSAAGITDSIVIIQRMQTGVEGLGNVCRTFDGVFGIDSGLKQGEADIIGVDGFHLVNTHTPHPQLQSFYLPDSWRKALEVAVPPLPHDEDSIASSDTSFIALVRGPKKCGKSTFARTLLNRLTTRHRHVAFLECDLGQSEFTPGGMVSLHIVSNPVFGPPFTHPRIPYRAHYIGSTTPRSNPSYYLSCIQALVQTYRMDVQYAYHETSTTNFSAHDQGDGDDDRIESLVPLVVNTHGWVKGLGGDLLRKIEDIIAATHIFDLDTQVVVSQRQHMQGSAASIYPLQPISMSPLTAYYTSADHRSLAILSYFHCVFPPQHVASGIVQWAADLPLCACAPWRVDCREAIDHIILMGAGYEDVVPQELTYAINCGVVALVCDEEPAAVESRIDSPFPYTQGASAPDPGTSHCVGLALVRGVDAATQTMHVLTPLPAREIAQCRMIVKGELELPVWGMLDFREGQDGVAGVAWGKVPYLQMGGQGARAGAIGAGAGRKRVRRNLMRRAQM